MQHTACDQRNDELRPGVDIAGDVPGEGMDIRYPLDRSGCGSGTADTFSDGNRHAGGLALEGPHHQRPVLQEIKAHPVDVLERVEQQRGQIGCIGHEVALPGQQGPRLPHQVRRPAGLRRWVAIH